MRQGGLDTVTVAVAERAKIMRTKSFINILVSLILMAGGCLAISGCFTPTTGSSVETRAAGALYDQVIKAGKIRCGYIPYPPGCMKDPNTGKLTGVCVEALEEAGKNLGLEIEWTEEVGWGSMIEGLQAGRYDIVGSAVWPTTARGKVADFTTPLFYSVLGAYVRADDNRLNSLKALNSRSVKVATIDGEISDIEARNQTPLAQRVSLPQTAQISQMMLNVVQKKADVAFVEPYAAQEFLKSNPGTLKNITVEKPLLAAGNTLMFMRGQPEFKSMIDTALQELILKGSIDRLLDKYDPSDAFYRVAPPYRLPGRARQ